jgi:hypothetical protein
MNRLEITLKQHTPLIHFQHGQEGATLRASEVKPKLDKFILTELKKLCPDIGKQYDTLIATIPNDTNKTNSPYKLSIRLKDKNAIDKYVIGSYIPRNKLDYYQRQGYRTLDKTSYFADNKPIKEGLTGEDDYKLGVMLRKNNSLDLVFQFWNPDWKEFLQKIIPLFLAITNFGTRQNKGFGCFYPVNSNETELERGLSLFSGNALYRSSLQFDNIASIFKEIDAIYKKMKSGGQRTDSELRKYFNNMRPVIEWEKPKIQEEIVKISRQRLKINSKTGNRQFVRALLGLPEIYEYPKSGDIKVLVSHKSEKKEDVIDRYASPISFKVFNGYIYLFASPKKSEITDKEFEFEIKGITFPLTTPKRFDVIDFVNHAMRNQRQWEKIL